LLPPACDEFLFYESLEGVEDGTRLATPVVARRKAKEPEPQVAADQPAESAADLDSLITRTLAGLQRSSGDAVLASSVKRALLRKDSTFSEADYGFRGFGEMLRHLEERGAIELADGPAKGDPVVQFPEDGGGENEVFELLRTVVADLQKRSAGPPLLSGLKNQVRKRNPEFSEKKFGYGGFLQFLKAAAARGTVKLDWDDAVGDYKVSLP
jgi:hypothetical protein